MVLAYGQRVYLYIAEVRIDVDDLKTFGGNPGWGGMARGK